jgi:hypothetical protein
MPLTRAIPRQEQSMVTLVPESERECTNESVDERVAERTVHRGQNGNVGGCLDLVPSVSEPRSQLAMIVNLAVARENNAKRIIHDRLRAVMQAANGQTDRSDGGPSSRRDSGAVRTSMGQRANHPFDALATIPHVDRVPERHDATDAAHVSVCLQE